MSLRRLKLERIDLYQLHRIDPKVPVEESLGALKEFQEAGKIRHIGLSEVSPAEIEQANKTVKIVSVQNQYNLSDRQHEKVLKYCEEHKLAFIPWFPVAAGKLAKPGGPLDQMAKKHQATVAQLSLAWLLHHSPVMLPIPGTSSVKHLEENMAAAKLRLSAEEWKAIESAARRSGVKVARIKKQLWASPVFLAHVLWREHGAPRRVSASFHSTGKSCQHRDVVSHISRKTSEMPGFPVRGSKQRQRVRLSLRKAA